MKLQMKSENEKRLCIMISMACFSQSSLGMLVATIRASSVKLRSKNLIAMPISYRSLLVVTNAHIKSIEIDLNISLYNTGYSFFFNIFCFGNEL